MPSTAGIVASGYLEASAFSPLDLSPKLWLDASDGSTVTVSGGRVSAWADKSGLGHGAASPAGIYDAHRETSSINGLDTVRFQSSTPTIMLIPNTTDLHLPADFSIFVVVKFTSVAKGGTSQNTIITNSNQRYELAEYQTKTGGYINGSGMSLGSVTLSAGVPYLLELHRDGSGNYSKLVDGASDATGTISGMASGDSLYLGWRPGGSGNTGGDLEIAELVIRDSELSSGEKVSMRSYLNAKWNI